MSTDAPKPTDWHRRSCGCFDNPCPICGASTKVRGEHRATSRDEGFKRRYLVRRRQGSRLKITEAGPLWNSSQKGIPRPRNFTGPTARVAQDLGKAAVLLARGKDLTQAAKELGTTVGALVDRRARYPELWAAATDQAREQLVEIVRAMAGTDEILKSPDEYIAMATVARKWTDEHGVELFPADGEMTLTRFHREYYATTCVAPDVTEDYRRLLEMVLNRWALVTGDPPIEQITNELLAKFRDFLMKSRGQKPGSRMSPTTVRDYMVVVRRILNKAGPPGFRNADAADLIPRVPYTRLPRAETPVPQTVDLKRLELVYGKADMMVIPQIPGVEPADWWRGLLVVALYTGLRNRSLFELRTADVDWEGRRIVLPPNRVKSRRAHIAPLNEVALKHLEAIRTDRDLVFEWPYSETHFGRSFHRLQWEAGLPVGAHFGLQNLRQTHGTLLWEFAPEAAQYSLGHSDAEVTRRHYVEGTGIVARAVEKLPVSDIFKDNGK